ncbi:MAG: AAA family ATPase [Candidatus Micrarchaeota archaeon]|nr:AAA family ATPase [Candidatus Micrarchaeota archaeon]MDE1847430.1 AAA family ATPase [Candidatus Micrarchaeota archaeon]MDE1864075.1 AAA family ATPase [Candidatus Micrarchaeota archaeon]
MGKIILFVGTPGAGKSTILEGIGSGKKVNIGTEMFEIARQRYKDKIANRDDMRRYLTPLQIKELRNDTFEKISRMTDKDDVIIDTHASIRNGNTFVPGFVLYEFDKLKGKIAAIIYIDASPQEILKRRRSDKSRSRDEESKSDVEEQKQINLSYTCAYSAYLGVPVYLMKNNDGKLKEAIKEAGSIVKEHFK